MQPSRPTWVNLCENHLVSVVVEYFSLIRSSFPNVYSEVIYTTQTRGNYTIYSDGNYTTQTQPQRRSSVFDLLPTYSTMNLFILRHKSDPEWRSLHVFRHFCLSIEIKPDRS